MWRGGSYSTNKNTRCPAQREFQMGSKCAGGRLTQKHDCGSSKFRFTVTCASSGSPTRSPGPVLVCFLFDYFLNFFFLLLSEREGLQCVRTPEAQTPGCVGGTWRHVVGTGDCLVSALEKV